MARLFVVVLNRIAFKVVDGETLATIIFSSWSIGTPEVGMLTHRNILSNVDAIGQLFELKSTDVLLGVLPFFHSFGFTGTI